MAIHNSDRPKGFVLRWILVFIVVCSVLALCERMTPSGEKDHLDGVEGIFR